VQYLLFVDIFPKNLIIRSRVLCPSQRTGIRKVHETQCSMQTFFMENIFTYGVCRRRDKQPNTYSS
jgi:hypothetical protein